MNRAIIITAFGDRRENVQRLIKNIRQYVDYQIHIITSVESDIGSFTRNDNISIRYVERLWPNHWRSGQRNGDYYQMKSVLESKHNSILYLDDDMLIVNKDFVQGFELAEKFGICLPLNPRSFVGVDAAIGTDVPNSERQAKISLATAYNCGTMFVDKRATRAIFFLKQCCKILLQTPMRGPLAVWKAVEYTGVFPYVLPVQWCVCQENVGCSNPIILHYGHKKVREYYSDPTLN